ncbi:MAG: potassium-transporting ATPase subunit KdpC [Acidobacteriota bacterium]|nr:potassium-transporting ATPase subunit KdpC [Acidobacteriota bacterium]
MKRNILTAVLMTIVTTILLGLVYPLVVTGVAQVLFHDKANGQLIVQDGKTVGSRVLAQPFTGAGYFHPRASAAGTNGYDATNSGGTNYGPTNQKLIDRVKQDVAAAQQENPGHAVPVDYVTTSASGLDPDITPANAEFQGPRVARERGISLEQAMALVKAHTKGRQLGVLGEARVNVLELNLDLDRQVPLAKRAAR